MLQITINNRSCTIFTSDLPDEITSLDIVFVANPFTKVQIPIDLVPMAKSWLYSIIDRCTCDFITYNNILQNTEDLRVIVANLRTLDETA